MGNSEQFSFSSRWLIFFTVVDLVVCVVGCIGCSLSLWCVKRCGEMLNAMKILLCTYFTVVFIICLVSLPCFTVAYTLEILHYQVKGIMTIFQSLYGLLINTERNVFMVITLYRMMAVCFPHQYKRWCRWQVVVALDAVIAFSSVLWSIVFGTQNEDNSIKSVTTYNPFLIYLVVPNIITVFTYAFTALVIHHRKRNMSQPSEQRSPMWDQVTLSLGVLFLMNVILHLPVIIVRLRDVSDKALLYFVHSFYRLHYACDAFIFLGLNARYRTRVLHLLSSCRPGSNLDSHPQEGVVAPDRLETTL